MNIKYNFELANNVKFVYEFKDNHFQKKEIESVPDSIKLEFNKCSNCTLKQSDYEYCPAAHDIIGVAIDFMEIKSIDRMKVIVEIDDKTLMKTCDVQSGLASFLGLVMATSECPVLSKFKNIAKIHQPFTSLEEIIIKIIGFEVINQLLVSKQQSYEFNLNSIYNFYKDINLVNLKFPARFVREGHFDAILNALTYYFFLSKLIQMNVDDEFEDLKYLFEN